MTRARGDEELSAKNRGGDRREPGIPGAEESRRLRQATASSAPSDLGRALRSVYDDTLRETVPDEFLNLIGKLD